MFCLYLSVFTSFLVRDSPHLMVQRSLTLSNIYLNFLLFYSKQSTTNNSIQHSAYLNSNSDACHSQLSTRGCHVTYTRDAYSQFELRCGSFVILDTRLSRDLHSRRAAVTWLPFKLSCTNPTNRPHFKLRSLVWNVTKNSYTAWLIVWISTNIGQPCNLGNTILCMGIQGHARPY